MAVKILGICGSPIAGGNTEVFLDSALEVARNIGAETEKETLAGKQIWDCRHCNWCLSKQLEGRPCVQEDDMQGLYPKILAADALLLATPVYIGRLSGYMACVLDRLRAFTHGNLYRGRLVDKIGGAMAVSWFRNAGLETALQSVVVSFLTFQMIPVGGLACAWGAPAVASQGGSGRFSKERRHGVLDDEYGLHSAQAMVRRMVFLAQRLKGIGTSG